MKYTIVAFLVFFAVGELYGQEKYTKQELIRMVKEERFLEAHHSLESYLRKFPKDPDYIFYAAICRVSLNVQVVETIELLLEATKQGKYKDSWFYLGRAYMLNYDFVNAGEAFERFNDKASREEKDRVQFTAFLAMCRNGIDICSKSKNVSVVRVDTISEQDLLTHLNKQAIYGTLEKTSEPGMFSARMRTGIKFTTAGKKLQTKYSFGKKHKDVFISEDDDIDLENSKPLGSVINSASDEDFIFYDETIPAIYFSSMGHNSAGGYDIFKSYYDKSGKKWSKPINLGFPINTPFDEVAYVTLPGTKKSLLVSRRNEIPGKLVIYTFENAEEASDEPIISANARNLSHFKPVKQINAPIVKSTSKNKTSATNRNEVPAEILNEQSYQRIIREALSLQIRSDSIKRISDDKKELLVASKYDSDKTKLRQEIKVLDSKADEIQQKADILYRKARELEAEKQEKNNAQELAQKAFSSKNNSNSSNAKTVEPTTGKDHPGINVKEGLDIKYRIQVGVFSKPPPPELFRNFTDVFNETVKDGMAVKYYVGLYQRIADAEKALIKVKDSGFKDAFIIGYYNGKIVPLSRARELELSHEKQ